MRVCVFCGSSSGFDPTYRDTAAALGRALVAAGHSLVYGGGRVGLMGALADAVLDAGGEVLGVIPRQLVEREVAHTGLTEQRVRGSMHERKAEMVDLADAFVALPGGYGTFDELFEVLTWLQLGIHHKPVVVVDVAGFYDPLFALADGAVAAGFLKASHRDAARRVGSVAEAIALLAAPPPPPESKWVGERVRDDADGGAAVDADADAGERWAAPDWLDGDAPAGLAERLAECANRWLAEPDRYGQHLALVVVHRGRVVAESYGPTADRDTALVSWSMAKSVVHALVGVCVRDGLLALHDPAPVPEWAGDARRDITLAQLLTMTSGLQFVEDYEDAGISDVIEMLFGTGQGDVAGFAIGRSLAHRPGTRWNYSSGTSNILARIVGDVAARRHPDDTREAAMRVFLRDELFGPLGMRSADPRFDPAGTFVGSSFLYATARDFARFGYLYLRDGVWGGRRVLPAGWAASAQLPAAVAGGHDPVPPDESFGYGHHWWIWDRVGVPTAFAAHGYEQQRIVVDPARDLVLVRLGKTPADLQANLHPDLVGLVNAVPIGL